MCQLTTGPKSKWDLCEEATDLPSVYSKAFVKAQCKSKGNYSPFVKSSGSHIKSKPNIRVFPLPFLCRQSLNSCSLNCRKGLRWEDAGKFWAHNLCSFKQKDSTRSRKQKVTTMLRQNSVSLSRAELVWN